MKKLLLSFAMLLLVLTTSAQTEPGLYVEATTGTDNFSRTPLLGYLAPAVIYNWEKVGVSAQVQTSTRLKEYSIVNLKFYYNIMQMDALDFKLGMSVGTYADKPERHVGKMIYSPEGSVSFPFYGTMIAKFTAGVNIQRRYCGCDIKGTVKPKGTLAFSVIAPIKLKKKKDYGIKIVNR